MCFKLFTIKNIITIIFYSTATMKKYLLALVFSLSYLAMSWAQFVPAISIDQPTCSNTARLTGFATGGTAPYTFTWSGGTGTGSIQTLTSGNYSVTVTDSSNPPNSRVLGAEVKNYRIPIIALSNQNIDCANRTITAVVTGTGNDYIWSDLNLPQSPRTISQAGTYTVVSSVGDRCSASVTVQNVRDDITVPERRYLCPGQTVIVNGVPQSSGTFTVLTTLPSGCTKTTILTLVQAPPSLNVVNQPICDGTSFTIAGQTYTTAGTRIITLPGRSWLGCDSTIRVNITVVSKELVNERVSRCEGDSYSIGNNTYTVIGNITKDTTYIYTNTLVGQGAGGCDKVVTTRLTFYKKYNLTNNIRLCGGTSITVNGKTYDSTGVYRDTMRSNPRGVFGCDSIVTTNLTVIKNKVRRDTVYRCIGDSYTIGGQTYNTSGNISTVFKDFRGVCDSSTVLTNLTFDTKFRIAKRIRLCTGSTYTVPVPGGPTYTEAGVYDFLTMSTTAGCDTLRTTTVQFGSPSNVAVTKTICKGQTYTVGSNVYSNAGVYTDVFQSVGFACDSTIVTTLIISNPELQSQVSYALCTGRSQGNIVLTINGGILPYTYNWGAGIPSIPVRTCLPKGAYSVTISDAAGCTAQQTINVYDEDYLTCLRSNEGITPDGDVHNETWEIPCIQDQENIVYLYNRWGQLILQAKNYSGGFNGTVDDKPLPDGTYYYVIETKAATHRGTLTILRQ